MTQVHREHQPTALDLLTQRLGSANQLIGAYPSQHTDSVQAESDNSLSATNFGTYDAENGGTIYLDARLLDKPALLQDVFNEELGHHLDSVLGGNDARGDEGAVFSQSLTRGILDQKTLLQLQVEQDHGYIDVDGEQIAVEFRSAEEGSGNGQSPSLSPSPSPSSTGGRPGILNSEGVDECEGVVAPEHTGEFPPIPDQTELSYLHR